LADGHGIAVLETVPSSAADHFAKVCMPESDCRVTVVIPLYNSVTTLPRAVQSVLRQTLRDCEVLIIDDASKDTSLTTARAFGETDPRIRVIALAENGGKSHAMNIALAQARGAWIAVLDADDWYEPARLATLIEAGEAKGVDLVADNQRFWDAGADMLVRLAFPVANGDTPLTREVFVAGSDPYAEFDYGMLKPIVRSDFIRRAGLSYRENARLSEDFLFLLEFLAAGGTGLLLAKPLYNWTQPFGSISRSWTGTGAGDWRYDYQSALAAHADVLEKLQRKQEAMLARLVIARMRAFRRLHHLNTISRMRRTGATLTQILVEVARHPSIWTRLIVRAFRVLRNHGGAREDAEIRAVPLRRH
jgi:succinoglycan biosynthesis protein ExoO